MVIHGVKWDDLDNDGLRDPGEPALAGWTIYLDANENDRLDWTDGDGDGRWDSGEGERFTTTDTSGGYVLDGLPFGDHVVSEVARPDWQQSFPRTASGSLTYPGATIVIVQAVDLLCAASPPVSPLPARRLRHRMKRSTVSLPPVLDLLASAGLAVPLG
ncbi:MAG: hypothetical protein GX591_05390 [Planctomycetes bacterium]|nr:hypothetical protein [Planctomycetota bacterium]